jgi:hypothetical protein
VTAHRSMTDVAAGLPLQPDPAVVEQFREELRRYAGPGRRLHRLAYATGAYAQIIRIVADQRAGQSAAHSSAVDKWLRRGLALTAALDAEWAEAVELPSPTPAVTP